MTDIRDHYSSHNDPENQPTEVATRRPFTNQDWWPEQLDLRVLQSNPTQGAPLSEGDFDYASEFETLDLVALKRDIVEAMTT